MESACTVCCEFKIPCQVRVVSAHRTPDDMARCAKSAHKRGLSVIIAGAGGAAHPPGMVASLTPSPLSACRCVLS
jgi:5-(carboxyamino)imidazole ribonucleotide mutase